MSDRQDSSRKTSSASGSTSSSGSLPKKRGPKSTCEKCKIKLRNVGYQAKHRANNSAPQKHTDGQECQQCAELKDEIAFLQAEVDRLLEGLCDDCYGKLHPNSDDVAGEETVDSSSAVSTSNASQAVVATTTNATASHLSSQQAASSTSYMLPSGTFGTGVVQRTSTAPSSAVIDYSTLPVEEEIYRFEELCRQRGHVPYVLRNAIVLTVENPQPQAPVRIQDAIHLDGLFVNAFYSGYMFRILESFYHF
ncbi:hypothetical protein AAVH_40757, partial [Aphelenchoides avenae]